MTALKKANLLIYPPLLVITLLLFYIISANQQFSALSIDQYFLGGLLVCFNLFVLSYHWFEKAHPKYNFSSKRTLILCIHLLGGSIELVCSLLAIIFHWPLLAIIAALSALLLHLPTAVKMIPEVSGAKGIMIPAYLFVVSLNAFFAVRVFVNPNNIQWIVCLFFSLNIYVLCRVFYVVFRKIGLFPYARYTAAILFSCFMLLPIILGTLGNIVFLLFILLNLLSFQFLLDYSDEQINDMYLEHQRTELSTDIIPPIVDGNRINRIIRQHPAYSSKKSFTDLELARLFFDFIDSDHNGYIDESEWNFIAQDWKVESGLKKEFFTKVAVEHQIDFMTFYHKIWLMGAHFASLLSQSMLADEEHARHVFKQLDLFNQNHLGELELKLLLTQWGLQEREISKFLQECPNGLSFEQFFEQYPSIWNYYRE